MFLLNYMLPLLGNILKIVTLFFILLLPANAPAATLDIMETGAARAFLDKDYQSALESFNQLASEHPQDLRIRRYQAICLEKLGEDEQAIEILIGLTLISTDPVSSHYHLGTIYYKLQQGELAEEQFNEVVLLADDSKYAKLAQSYLDAIGKQQFESVNPGAPRKWNFYASVGYVDDISSDSTLISNNAASSRTNSYLSASYYFLRESRWTGLMSASVYQSNQQSDSTSTYDMLRRWSSKVSLQNQATLFGKPAIHLGNLSYGRSELDGSLYADDWLFYLSTKIRFRPNASTGLYASKGKSRFWNIGQLDMSTSRSERNRTSLGVDQSIFVRDRKVELGVGAYYRDVTSINRNLNRESKGFKLFSRFALPKKVKLNLVAELQKDNYPDFNGVGNRTANTKNLTVALLRRIGKHVSMEVSYKASEIGFSDLDQDRRRNTLGVRISYVY